MIVWGGSSSQFAPLATGGQYDPLTDSWRPTTSSGAPTARDHRTGVWTGSRMIVWGGSIGEMALRTGGQYLELNFFRKD